jgi:hypothetical protein
MLDRHYWTLETRIRSWELKRERERERDESKGAKEKERV